MLNSRDDDNVTPTPHFSSPLPFFLPCCVFIFCAAPHSQRLGWRGKNSHPGPWSPSIPLLEPYCVLVVVCRPTLSTRSPFPPVPLSPAPVPSLPCPYKMTTVLRFYDACAAQYPLCTSAVFSLSLSVPLQANMPAVQGVPSV